MCNYCIVDYMWQEVEPQICEALMEVVQGTSQVRYDSKLLFNLSVVALLALQTKTNGQIRCFVMPSELFDRTQIRRPLALIQRKGAAPADTFTFDPSTNWWAAID